MMFSWREGCVCGGKGMHTLLLQHYSMLPQQPQWEDRGAASGESPLGPGKEV